MTTKHSSVVLKTMTPLSLGQPRLVSHIIHYDAFTSGANLYPRGAWFADVMMSFSGATFVLFCFVFVFYYAFIEAAALRSIVLR